MSNKVTKVKVWAEDENRVLKSLREDVEPSTWPQISQKLNEILGVSRTAKQCRDRYFNHLLESEGTLTWLNTEIETLFRLFFEFGAKWSIIAKSIKTKNEVQIKNFFYSTIRRNIRKFNKGKLEGEKIILGSLSILENQELREILTTTKKVGRNFFSSKFLTRSAIEVISGQFKERDANKDIKIGTNDSNNEIKNTTQLRFEDVILRLDEIEPISYY